MTKLSWLFLLLVLSSGALKAQTVTYTPEEKAALDSMFAADEFFQLYNADKDSSYFEASVGLSNGVFSTHNLAENATGVTNRLVLTPSLTYHHKSGFGLGATFFLSSEANTLQLYQTGLTGSYDHVGNKWNTGIAYTRYLSDRDKYNSNSLYQNDWYGYFKKAKGIIEPGIAIGYSSGEYKQIDARLISLPLKDTIINDTTSNKARYFSISVNAEHQFKFFKVIRKSDELDITPSLILNAGSEDATTKHLNKKFNQFLLNHPKIAKNIKRTNLSSGLELQSVAFLVDLTYSVGKFFVEPNVYLDYFLPSTTSKRLNSYFSVTAGFYF